MEAVSQIFDTLMRAQIASIPSLNFGFSSTTTSAALRGAAPRQLQLDYQLLAFIVIATIVTAGVAGCMIYNYMEDKRFQEKQDYMMRPRPQRDENEVDGEIPDAERNPEVVVAPISR